MQPEVIDTTKHGGQNSAPVWLQRLSLFVLVIFCVYIGAFVTAMPWISRIWDHNNLFNTYPLVGKILRNGAVKGLISGLGLLDIWVGISEVIQYRDYRG